VQDCELPSFKEYSEQGLFWGSELKMWIPEVRLKRSATMKRLWAERKKEGIV
jgi:hypothetical protein